MWWLIGLVAIVLFACSPLVPLSIAYLLGYELDAYNESNSVLGTLPWLLFFTVPAGAVVLLGWIIYGIVSLAMR
jgi:hypothetical protein